MSEYYTNYAKKDPFEFMPVTYNVTTESQMSQNKEILKIHKEKEAIWIVKPGKNSNRGRGIRIFTVVEKIYKFLE
jgi:hypothetical protein